MKIPKIYLEHSKQFFFCKKLIFKKTWKQRNNSNFNNHNSTSEKSTYSKLLTCHYCGKPSHIRPNCKIIVCDKANGVLKPQANATSSGNYNNGNFHTPKL
jgi:hypothetical protein